MAIPLSEFGRFGRFVRVDEGGLALGFQKIRRTLPSDIAGTSVRERHEVKDAWNGSRYVLGTDAWNIIPQELKNMNSSKIALRDFANQVIPLECLPTSPGVYVNLRHPALSEEFLTHRACRCSVCPDPGGAEHMCDAANRVLTVDGPLITSLVSSVRLSNSRRLGRFAVLEKTSLSKGNLARLNRSTPLSHCPTAGGTYVDLADRKLVNTLLAKHHTNSSIVEAVRGASIVIPDKRLFLVATWLKERDWMLGRLREDEFRYLLEWVGIPRSPELCNLNGCPCGHRLDG